MVPVWIQWSGALASFLAIYVALTSIGSDKAISDNDRINVDQLAPKLDSIMELLRRQTEQSQRMESSLVSAGRELKQLGTESVKQLKVMITGQLEAQAEWSDDMSSTVEAAAASFNSMTTKLLKKLEHDGVHGTQIEDLMRTLTKLVESLTATLSNIPGSRSQQHHRVGRLISDFADNLYGPGLIRGMAELDGIIYVARNESDDVYLYRSNSHKRLGSIEIKGLNATDMASSTHHRSVFIADYKGHSVYRLTTDGSRVKHKSTWTFGFKPWGVSVMYNGNILLTFPDSWTLEEYTADGTLVREIVLDRKLSPRVWHAIELSRGMFVASFGEFEDKIGEHKVCTVDALGQIGKCYLGPTGSESNMPFHITKAGNSVLVCCVNNRVIELSSSLDYVGTLLSCEHGLDTPTRMQYDEATGQLYVASHEADSGILINYKYAIRGRLKLFDISIMQ